MWFHWVGWQETRWFDGVEQGRLVEESSVGCLCTRAGWFKHSEPLRTYTNHNTLLSLCCCGSCRFDEVRGA